MAGVRGGDENEEYWPGIFIQAAGRGRVESAFLVIRADGSRQGYSGELTARQLQSLSPKR